jgi:hypothetical protein
MEMVAIRQGGRLLDLLLTFYRSDFEIAKLLLPCAFA